MADGYSVGNLKIAFNALDQTSDDFKKLATNLRAIVNLINRISTADLGKFSANVKEITKAFNPFLTKLEKSTAGLQAFDSVARQIGVRNMPNVVQTFDDIQQTTQEAAEGVGRLNGEIVDGQNQAQNDISQTVQKLDELRMQFSRQLVKTPSKSQIYELIRQTNAELDKAREKAERYKRDFVNLFGLATPAMRPGSTEYFSGMVRNIEDTDNAVKELENRLSTLKNYFGTPFNDAQAQISKLTQEMLNLHFATGQIDDTVINQIVEQTNAVTASRKAIDEAIAAKQREKMTDEELKIALQNETIAQYNAANAERKRLISYYEAKIATAKAGESVKEYRKELERLKKEDGQVGKKSGFSKFLGQIKRIAIYRLIRAGLKAVTSAFKDGINALAQFDSGVNKTMSQLTTSFTVMKLSVSTALLPLLQSITPIIQQIAQGFANMANVISASMSKTGYYTKINTDRLLAYNKAANLFDFDKFRALNKGDEAMNLLSTEKVEDLNKDLGVSYANYKLIYDIIKNIGQILNNVFGIISKIFQAASPIVTVVLAIADALLYVVNGITWVLDKSGLLTPVLYAILGYFIAIGATKFITWLKSGALATWFKTAAASASTFGGKLLAVLGTTQALAVAIGALIGSISYYIQNLDKMSTTAKVLVPVIAALAAVFTGLAVAKAAAAAGIAAPAMAGITAGALAAAIALAAGTAISVGVGKFANGGLPDKGSMFVAGEHGAEFVYNMPSGQSGVANIQQIAQAVYQGTYQATMDWWKSAKNDIGGDVYLDGEKIYQNTTSHASKHGKKWSNV